MADRQIIEDYIRKGDISAIGKYLFGGGTNIDYIDTIQMAVEMGEFNIVTQMIGFIEYDGVLSVCDRISDAKTLVKFASACRGADIQIEAKHMITKALSTGDPDSVKTILGSLSEYGYRIDFKRDGKEYLIGAIKSKSLQMTKMIFKKCVQTGILHNLRMVVGDIIDSIIDSDSLEIACWIESTFHDFGVNIYDSIQPKKLLKKLCEHNNKNIFRYLLDMWGDQIDIHEKGELLFRTACEEGSTDAAKILYEYAQDINSPINLHAYNNYAFEKACWRNRLDTVIWLDSVGCEIDITEGDHSVFVHTFQNNNKEVADWFCKRYPIYRLAPSRAVTCSCAECMKSVESSPKKYVIDEMNYLENCFDTKNYDAVRKYLTKRTIIQIPRIDPDDLDENERDCIICGMSEQFYINTGCGQDDHLYCMSCLTKHFRINRKKECIICNKSYEDSDLRLVEIYDGEQV